MEADGHALTAAGLAGLAGVSEADVGRMAGLGVLVPRDGPASFGDDDGVLSRASIKLARAGLALYAGVQRRL